MIFCSLTSPIIEIPLIKTVARFKLKLFGFYKKQVISFIREKQSNKRKIDEGTNSYHRFTANTVQWWEIKHKESYSFHLLMAMRTLPAWDITFTSSAKNDFDSINYPGFHRTLHEICKKKIRCLKVIILRLGQMYNFGGEEIRTADG